MSPSRTAPSVSAGRIDGVGTQPFNMFTKLDEGRSNRSLLRAAGVAMVLAIGVLGLTAGTPFGAGISVATLFGITTWRLVSMERRRWGTIGLGSPLSLTAISWFAYFGVLSLGAYDDASRNPLVGSNPWGITLAVGVVLCSLLVIAAGYSLVTKGLVPRPQPQLTGATLALGGLVVALIVGWSARFYLFHTGRFGYLSGGEVTTGLSNRVVQSAATLLTLGLVILAIAAWSPRGLIGLKPRYAKWLLILNVLPLGVTSVASGVKGQLISDLTPVAVAFLMLRGRIPWRAVVAALTYLVFVLPGMEQYREDLNSGVIVEDERAGIVNASVNATSRVLTEWVRAGPADQVVRLWDHVTRQYSTMSRNLAVIIHRTPHEIPHLGNSRLASEPLFFLPGDVLGRNDFNVYAYMNMTYLDGSTASAEPPTQPGDFYMSGGWSTVVVGQLVVGLFVGLGWRLLVLRRGSEASIAAYAVMAGVFVSAGIEWGTLSRGLLQAAVVLVPAAALWLRPAPAPDSRSVSPR